MSSFWTMKLVGFGTTGPRPTRSELPALPDEHAPRLGEQHVEAPQLLRGDSRLRHRGVALPALHVAAQQRREELSVETSVVAPSR
jgi:hypothetical protein